MFSIQTTPNLFTSNIWNFTLAVIFFSFLILTVSLSLHLDTWSEPDGFNHWLYSYAWYTDNVEINNYFDRKMPLYYATTGLLLHTIDPVILSKIIKVSSFIIIYFIDLF